MSGKKIKVALCLSGEPRSSMFCFPYIYESFINLGPEYEVNVYIHSKTNFRAFSLYQSNGWDSEFLSLNQLSNVLSEISLPPSLKESFNFYNNYTSQTNLVSHQIYMLEGIYKSFKLIPSENPPDIVIRCCFDIFTDSRIFIDNIIRNILNKKYDIFIPSKISPKKGLIRDSLEIELNDQLAIGNYKSMFYYSDMINNLNFLVNDTQEWKVECWLKSQLNYYKVKVNSYYIPFHLVRSTQVQLNRGGYSKDMVYLDS